MLQRGQPNAGAGAVVIGPPRNIDRQGHQPSCVGGGHVDVRHAQARFHCSACSVPPLLSRLFCPACSVPPLRPFLVGLRARSCSAAGSSGASMTSPPTVILARPGEQGRSWSPRRPGLRARSEPPHRTLELFPQPLQGRGRARHRPERRRGQLPPFAGELPPRHGRLPADPPSCQIRIGSTIRVNRPSPPPSGIDIRTGVLHMLVHAEPDGIGEPGRDVDRRLQQRRVEPHVAFRGRTATRLKSVLTVLDGHPYGRQTTMRWQF